MSDPIHASNVQQGQRLLAADTNASVGACQDLAVRATTGVVTGTAVTTTVTALLVSDIGMAGGVSVAGTVVANQGAAGTAAWPVSISLGNVGVSSIPAISIAAAQSISAAITGTQTITGSVNATIPAVSIAAAQSLSAAITGTQTITGSVNATIPAISIAAAQSVSAVITGTQTITGSVNATIPAISIAAAQSLSAAITGTQTITGSVNATIPAVSIAAAQSISASISAGTMSVNVNTIGSLPICAVLPGVTKTATKVNFAITQTSATVALIVSTGAGSRNILLGWGVWNMDTNTHNLIWLEGATNSVMFTMGLAPNGGGNQVGLPTPFPVAESRAVSLSLSGALGTNAVQGWVLFTTAAT